MKSARSLAAVAILPALLACSALGVCWRTFASGGDHGCCDRATSTATLGPGSGACASRVVGATLPHVHAPEAWAALPTFASARDQRVRVCALARVLPAKAPPLVLRI